MAESVTSLVLEPLVGRNRDTLELYPLLAKDWTTSSDGKRFTFRLRPEARFSDGRAVTAEDVLFTWQTVTNPKNLTGPFQGFFSSFSGCKAIDAMTVEFWPRPTTFSKLGKALGTVDHSRAIISVPVISIRTFKNTFWVLARM